ncbi:hypothetical protein [Dongia sp. agr-C8]
MKRTALGLLMAAGVVGAFGLEAQATTLDFGNTAGSAANCIENSTQPCYGSRVNNTTDPNGFGTYGLGNGFTPNVVADYTGTNQRLVTVSAANGGGAVFATSFHGSSHVFTLTADAGFNVQLNAVTVKNSDIPGIDQTENFEVWADGTHLTSLDFTYTGQAPLSFTFASLIAQSISIISDSAFAGLSAANFDQVAATPIPAALPLFASGLGALGFARWRKSKRAAKAA